MAPRGGSEGEFTPFAPHLSPSFCWWLAILDVPGLIVASFQSLLVPSRDLSLSVSLRFSFSVCYEDTVCWIQNPTNWLIASQDSYRNYSHVPCGDVSDGGIQLTTGVVISALPTAQVCVRKG